MAWCFSTLPRIGCAMRSARWWGGGKEGGALAFFWLLLLPLARTATCPRAFRAGAFSLSSPSTSLLCCTRGNFLKLKCQRVSGSTCLAVGSGTVRTVYRRILSVYTSTETGFRFARKARLNMQWWTRLFHSRSSRRLTVISVSERWCFRLTRVLLMCNRVTSMENQVVDTVFLLDRLSVRYGWLDKLHEFIRVKTDSRVSEKPRLNRIRDTS
jgi:hypothetical protein